MSKTASDAGSQILLYSTQGKGVRQEVGQGIKVAQADQRNGQSAFSIATMNDCNLTEYNFLSLSTSQGFQLVGSIVEIDVDYSFYNVAQGINNTLFLSIGELDPATNQPIFRNCFFRSWQLLPQRLRGDVDQPFKSNV
jgi:hypothetical protein